MTVDTQVTWLTQEAYDRLKHELDELIANRPVIAAEINARREEGDLKENGGYHAAREEQGQQEARIRQLQELLRTAQVGDGAHRLGHRRTRDGASRSTTTTTRATSRRCCSARARRAAHGDLQVISPHSPLGAALLGARVGETREYRLPGRRQHEGHARLRGALHRLTPTRTSEPYSCPGRANSTSAPKCGTNYGADVPYECSTTRWPASCSASTSSRAVLGAAGLQAHRDVDVAERQRPGDP